MQTLGKNKRGTDGCQLENTHLSEPAGDASTGEKHGDEGGDGAATTTGSWTPCIANGGAHGVEDAPIGAALPTLDRLDEAESHRPRRCDSREGLFIWNASVEGLRLARGPYIAKNGWIKLNGKC